VPSGIKMLSSKNNCSAAKGNTVRYIQLRGVLINLLILKTPWDRDGTWIQLSLGMVFFDGCHWHAQVHVVGFVPLFLATTRLDMLEAVAFTAAR
jgi:hypothetical protein